jgi:hypothetical protein
MIRPHFREWLSTAPKTSRLTLVKAYPVDKPHEPMIDSL